MNAHVIENSSTSREQELLEALIDFMGNIDGGADREDFQEVKKQMLNSGMTPEDLVGLLGDNFLETVISRTLVNVSVQLLTDTAKIPEYSNVTDGCADIYADEDVWIKPGETRPISTGIAIAIPDGFVVHIYPRSGLSMKTGIRLANSVGIIDAGYRDELKILLWNTGDSDFHVEKGMRIAQMDIMQSPAIDFVEVEDIKNIPGDRMGGFGSSGLFDMTNDEPAGEAEIVATELENANGEI